MHLWLRRLFRNEQGQDIAEYTLIVGFIAIVGVAVFASSGGSMSRVWSTASSITSSANLLLGGPPSVDSAEHGSGR
jgi:Flp pilus assembly pilin Flp